MIVTKDLTRRFEELRARRLTWESHWQEVADFVLPRRGNIYGMDTPGGKRSQRIYDGTAMEANELLAAGLHGMLTSPATPWFELALKDADLARDQQARAWLDETARRMHAAFNTSNFQTEVHELYLDLGCFGTAAMFVEDDVERGLRFSTRALSEIFIDQNADGRIDTVFRRFDIPARHALQLWGEGSVGTRIQGLCRERPDATLCLLHAVFAREECDRRRRDAKSLPFASVYIDLDGDHVIAEGGFNEFPYVVPRWTKSAGEVFGRSPAMKALPEIKLLNEMCRTTIRAAQKVVDPPMLVADDGVVLPVRTAPSSLNFARFLADGRDPIRPLQTNANVGIGLQMEETRRDAIRSAFFVNQLQIVGSPQMTATEVLHRAEEKLRVLGPMLGRLQSEFLGPLVERAYGSLMRAGRLPPPPPSLAGAAMDVAYVSPIAREQRSTEAQGLLRLMEIAAPLAQVQPDLTDNIDGDAALRHLWTLFSQPQALLRDPAEVESMRMARSAPAAPGPGAAPAPQPTDLLTQMQAMIGGPDGA